MSCGSPLVLGDEGARLHGNGPLGERRGEALSQRGDPGDVLDTRLRIRDAELDRAELRMRSHVPPDVRVVGKEARFYTARHEPFEIGERGQARRQTAARHHIEDLTAGRRETGVRTLPGRRVRGTRGTLRGPVS